ncbi:MAG: hypothetical protein OEM27_03210 [Nitrospinota bacterium]|nr:hypothetical protein [Nitrospinota bacterium]
MFYEVRIKSPKGELKKIVSTQELSKAYWDSFNKIQLPNPESLMLLREHKKQINAADYHAGRDKHL